MERIMIGAAELTGRTPEGMTFPISIRIGIPYRRDDGDWACPLAIEGLYEPIKDVVGLDSFQALCLACRQALEHLQDWRDNGGGLLTADGFDWPLSAYLPLVRPHGPVQLAPPED